MASHCEFASFLVRCRLWWSLLASYRVKLSVREFFKPYICSIEKENWLSCNCQRRSHLCACIFDKFSFTISSIPLQSVRIRKGFEAKKIKNFSIPLMTTRIFFFHRGIVAFCIIKTSNAVFVKFFSFFNFEYRTSVLIVGICLKNYIISFIK